VESGPQIVSLPEQTPAQAAPPMEEEAAALPAATPTVELAGVNNETWLRRQNAEHYTIQVLGAYNAQALDSFVDAHGLRGQPELAMFKSVYKDKDWYVLVYGLYADRGQASAAVDRLPPVLRQATQPWVRSLGSIQTELERTLQ
jgi:DamX protein